MSIAKRIFGKLSDGREVSLYELENKNGMRLILSEFGAAMVKIVVNDKNGDPVDVICGYDDVKSYELGDGYQGAIVGRWANRIRKGRFTLDGVEYQLPTNNGENHLHGGTDGHLSHIIWNSEAVSEGDEPSVRFSCTSPDGSNGYPGTLSVSVTYTLTKDNGVSIRYNATTDKKTILSLTNHSYFNLGGYDSGSIADHVMTVDAESFLETDEGLIPTGRILSVEGTPFDFRASKRLGDEIDSDFEAIRFGLGYDHCLNFAGWEEESREVLHRATLYCAKTGIEMKVLTNSPCVQIYSGNVMNNKDYPFKNGVEQIPRNAICIETQRMPDSMNHEGFTKAILDVGETYDYTTVYKFENK